MSSRSHLVVNECWEDGQKRSSRAAYAREERREHIETVLSPDRHTKQTNIRVQVKCGILW